MSAATSVPVRCWTEDDKRHCEAWSSVDNFMAGVNIGTAFPTPYIQQRCLDTDDGGLPAPILLLDEDTVYCNFERFKLTPTPTPSQTLSQPVVSQGAFYPFAKSVYVLLKHYSAISVTPPPEVLPIAIPGSSYPFFQPSTRPRFIHRRPAAVSTSNKTPAPMGSVLGTLPRVPSSQVKFDPYFLHPDPAFSPPIMGSSPKGRPIAVFARRDSDWAIYCGMYIFHMVVSDDEEGHRFDFSLEKYMNLDTSTKSNLTIDMGEEGSWFKSFVEGKEWNRLQHVPRVWMRMVMPKRQRQKVQTY